MQARASIRTAPKDRGGSTGDQGADTLLTAPGVPSSVDRSMAKARPLRKTGRKTGGKSAKERQLSRAEVKRTPAKHPPKPADGSPSRKPVPLRPTRKAVVVATPERQMAAAEIAPPLPAPIASFTF